MKSIAKKIYANLKSNIPKQPLSQYYKELDSKISPKDDLLIFPPLSHLALDSGGIKRGAQSVWPEISGAFSGLVSLTLLQDLGISNILLGHSEEREFLKRDLEFIRRSFDFFANKNMHITLCVGERAEHRRNLETIEVLKKQLSNIDLSYEKLNIAYEPLWAIGSGECAECEQIHEAHLEIKQIRDIPVLYGGSVNATNAQDILNMPLVDGALIGGASLDVNVLLEIIQIARDIAKDKENA